VHPMMAAKKIITAMVAALSLTGTACAGLTPVSSTAAAPVPSSYRADHATCAPAEIFPLWAGGAEVAGLDLLPIASWPGPQPQATRATKSPQVLTDNQSSLSLCLYVLMGAGLCRSIPLMKRMSLGWIPDWYHEGGPFQVGHSHAIGPDLCPAPLVCFIQPDNTAEDLTPKYDRGTITSLVRKSLFTPNLLASRGPPASS
jgi:hypothetical protein